jgi:hypothetical protein
MKVRNLVKGVIGFAVGSGAHVVVTSSVNTLMGPEAYSSKSAFGKFGIRLVTFGLAAITAIAVDKYYSDTIDNLFDSAGRLKEAKEKYKGWTKKEILEDLAKQTNNKNE